MKSSPYRAQFMAYVLAMMADNIEHVISYWVVFQKFHSPALAGFAVLSHWLPFLFFSVYFGAMADRFDSRRIIQVAMLMYMAVSFAWAVLLPAGFFVRNAQNLRLDNVQITGQVGPAFNMDESVRGKWDVISQEIRDTANP